MAKPRIVLGCKLRMIFELVNGLERVCKMQTNGVEQQRYYGEIQDCIELENLYYYIQKQKHRISSLRNSIKGKKLPNNAWIWLGVTVFFLFPAVILWGLWIYVNLKNNKKEDIETEKIIANVEEDLAEKNVMYEELYSNIQDRFAKGEFSIHKDCWHCGNELMRYFNENQAFSFKDALYYVDKRRDREAMERGLQNAYSNGYSSGCAAGYSSGYAQGQSAGYSQGKKAGSSSGYSSGLRDGYFLGK